MGSDDTLWLFLRLVIALPVVLLMAHLTIRYVLGRKTFLPGVRRMRLVESLPFGIKGSLALVEMGGRYYFLACQEGAVALIKEMDELPAPLAGPATGSYFDLGAMVPKLSGAWRKAGPDYLVKRYLLKQVDGENGTRKRPSDPGL